MGGPGYGWCCACEGEISPRDPVVVFLPFQAPDGFRGWGCAQCHLPAGGSVNSSVRLASGRMPPSRHVPGRDSRNRTFGQLGLDSVRPFWPN